MDGIERSIRARQHKQATKKERFRAATKTPKINGSPPKECPDYFPILSGFLASHKHT